jgi:hypothetical protein
MLQTYFEAWLTRLLEIPEMMAWGVAEALLVFGIRVVIVLTLLLIVSGVGALAKCFRSRTPPSARGPSRRASAPD